jgi:hypothetical protein
MDRETKTLEIEGHSFIVKAYATAREVNTIQQALFKGTKVGIVGDQPQISEFDPGGGFEMQSEMIRIMVVSMDGQTDFMTALEALPHNVWDELIAVLDPLVSKKKNSATPSAPTA